jgi:hypothetical protein
MFQRDTQAGGDLLDRKVKYLCKFKKKKGVSRQVAKYAKES